jgi:hypothetical protein
MTKSKSGIDVTKLSGLLREHEVATAELDRLRGVEGALVARENLLLGSGAYDDTDAIAESASLASRLALLPGAILKVEEKLSEIDSALVLEGKRVGALAATRAADKHGVLVEKLITIMLPFWEGDKYKVECITATSPALLTSGAASNGWTLRLGAAEQMPATEFAEGVLVAVSNENAAA